MRICLIGNATAPHLQRWARAYRDSGHDVEIVSIRSATLEGIPIHTVSVGPTNDPGKVWSFLSYARLAATARRVVGRCDPDVVHAHFTHTSGIFARLAGKHPTVLTAWGSDVIPADGVRQNLMLQTLNRRALDGADHVTVASRYLAHWVTKLAPNANITVVPFGVNTAVFLPRERRVERTDGLSIGIVKSLEPRYGIEHAIEAMRRVRDVIPDATLTIAGEGSLSRALKQLTAQLDLEDAIGFLGRVDHRAVPGLMQSFDILLNPTVVPESFGVVILEGQAAGIPVVSSDVGGVREVCDDGRTARLVPPADPHALATAIIELAEDPSERHRLGIAGREYVTGKFEWERCVAQMLRVLEDVARRT